MSNKYKKQIEEHNRRVYASKSLQELKRIGKVKKGLLNVDQYKKTDRNVLIERLVKGKQLSDYSKEVLLEKAQNEGLNANASMSKNVILQKITNPKLTDLNESRLRKLAEKGGIPLRSQMTNRAIIQRLEDPTKYYTVESLKRLARNNNIQIPRNISKPDLINVLGERNLITTTPITSQESNLGVAGSKVPIRLIQKAKRKARDSLEDLKNYKNYIKNIQNYNLDADRLKKLTKQLEKKEKKVKDELNKIFTPIREESAFRNFTTQYVMSNNNLGLGPKEFLEHGKQPIINIFNSNRNIKTMLYLHVIMKREQPGEPVPKTDKFAFHSKGLKLVLEGTNEEDTYDEMAAEILEEIDMIEMAEGSGWVFVKVEKLVLHTTRWDPVNAGSYIELPQELKNRKAIINMKNQDDKCFMWSVLRALNPERIDNDLKSKVDTLNMKGIQYPVSLRGIDRFEHLNPEISITVLGYNEEEKVYPLKVSKYTGCEHDIVLLLIKDKENSHYCLVKNISALLSSQINNHKGTRYFCLNCFNGFKSPDSLDKHKEYCYNNECVKISMPPPNTFLRFKNFRYSEKAPFAIYADFESLIKPLDNCDPDPNRSYTKKYQKHEPISFCYYIKCFNDTLCKEIFNDDTKRKQLKSYIKTKPEDPDAIDVFIKWLEDDVKFLANITPKKMIFTKEDEKQFNTASDCWICGEELKHNDKVRDHCHYTGRYRGAAHNSCNLKYSKPKGVPVFFHNLTGYDSHLFIKKLGSSNEKETIECIPNNEEKYITFTKNIIVGQYINKKGEDKDKTFKIVFKDSLKFMSSSLGALVNNLPKNGFKNISKYYTPEQVELIKQKGFYPYEFMDTEEKFNDTKLPPQKAFYSKLSGKGISEKDYKHAWNVWNTFKMKTLKDYHKLYNETDVLLLADVFENFRNLCLKIYGLDPVYYFTAPGLAWDACLKMTNINLELLSDPNMLLMFEKGIRGGISIISNRYGEANNKYMGNRFNKNKLKNI